MSAGNRKPEKSSAAVEPEDDDKLILSLSTLDMKPEEDNNRRESELTADTTVMSDAMYFI
jgi:hypothetical protein